MKKTPFGACFTALFLLAGTARAELVALDVIRREPFAEGKAFGKVGPYDRIVALARFRVDPAHARNRVFVDLPLAPRNKEGKVELEADVFILLPRDLARGNGALLY